MQRWLLIPAAELHASSVQHPDCAAWRWLLHSRRVPVCDTGAETEEACECSSASQQRRPRCAGTGDAGKDVWMCRECLADLGRSRPRIPKNALANDNWIGREPMVVRDASQGTKWLSCLGRACWRQIRLGRGAAHTQQRGLSGNVILLAQPSASIPSLEQPPPEDALVDALSVVFCH